MKLPIHAVLLSALALPAAAHEYALGNLVIDHPYAFATAPAALVAGGYLSIVNGGETDDRLTAVRVAPEHAGLAQLHEMRMEGDVMRMEARDGGIPVPAGESVVLEPGGLHVMFMRLPRGLEVGAEIPATLVFERAGEVEIVFNVEARGGAAHADHGSDDH